jgi:hypothetical protein
LGHNIYYSPESLGLEIFPFAQMNLDYQYAILLFVRLASGGPVYYAADAGCSCPTPFELYDSETGEEALRKLSRVKDINDALAIHKQWVEAQAGEGNAPSYGRRENYRFLSWFPGPKT